jgi:hypothetical protein
VLDSGAARRRFRGEWRCRGDAGAVLVEAALVSPVFMFLVLGILDMGGLFRSYLTLEHAVLSGARMVSIGPTNGLADWRALQSMRRAATAIDITRIERVVIWHPASPVDVLDASCAAGHPSETESGGSNVPWAVHRCNVYDQSAFGGIPDDDPSHFDCTPGAPHAAMSPSRFWCPTERDAGDASADYIGFTVDYHHRFTTGFFGAGRRLTATSIARAEPESM